jgi:two-component system, cell cycle sensor histidine kinase and response regulator CckA
MASGGTLTITTRPLDAFDPGDDGALRSTREISLHQQIAFSIADTGCGIDPSVEDRVFEPFFTTKRASGHAGLGLSTVYGIVRQSRGMIRVASGAGRGTCFTISFPAAANASRGLDSRVAS